MTSSNSPSSPLLIKFFTACTDRTLSPYERDTDDFVLGRGTQPGDFLKARRQRLLDEERLCDGCERHGMLYVQVCWRADNGRIPLVGRGLLHRFVRSLDFIARAYLFTFLCIDLAERYSTGRGLVEAAQVAFANRSSSYNEYVHRAVQPPSTIKFSPVT